MTNGHPVNSDCNRQALTLIEIMIALTMTLVVLGAMMQAFKYASDEMGKGRAMMEGANQIRAAEDTLRRDLTGLTVEVRPHLHAIPTGYFEYVEGPRYDRSAYTTGGSNSEFNYLGDVDDILAMTVRSEDRPFRGRFVNLATGNTEVIESSVAEVVWFTVHNNRDGDVPPNVDFDETITLYRRVLLIRPDINLAAATIGDEFYAENDISTRIEGGALVANSLTDLAYRQNRYCHGGAFPHILNRGQLFARRVSDPSLAFGNATTGDDILLTNVCAFDVRTYSSNANVNVLPGLNRFLEQGDVNYQHTPTTVNVLVQSRGSYVDIGSAFTLNPQPTNGQGNFTGDVNAKSNLSYQNFYDNSGNDRVYDTWTPEYEFDGVDQDNDGDIDEATNGQDDVDTDVNGNVSENSLVDDEAEREAFPPYPSRLRGLKITFRVIEKNSKQIRQSSIIHSFVPQ